KPVPVAAATPPAGNRLVWIAVVAVGVVVAAIVVWSARDRSSGGTPTATSATVAHYAGGGSCVSCHEAEHAAWHGSDHDLAMQVASDTSVLGDFNNAKFSYAGMTTTFSRRDGKFIVNTDGPDGQLHDYEIGYTFGVRPLQQYLIDF